MIAARQSVPPFFTDGRRHPEHPLESVVRSVEANVDRYDFGDACEPERERAEEQSTGVELLGVELDLEEATAPFVQLDDDNDPTEPFIELPWYARSAS